MTELLHKDITEKIIGAAMEVHRTLGAGFLEAVWDAVTDEEKDLVLAGLKPEEKTQILSMKVQRKKKNSPKA